MTQPVSVSAALARAVACADPVVIAEIRRLRDQVDELRRSAGLTVAEHFPATLSPLQREILGALIARGFVARATLFASLYGAKPECDWPADPVSVLKVEVCRMRRVLDPLGVTFSAVPSRDDETGGYMMPRHIRLKAKRMMELHRDR